MKTNLFRTAVLAASLSAGISSASAEPLRARIPFGFSAGGTAMPAGAYSIRPIPGAPGVLLFENETTKMQAIVFVRTRVGSQAKPPGPPLFTEGADRMELTDIATSEWTYELSTQAARRPQKGVALTLASAGK